MKSLISKLEFIKAPTPIQNKELGEVESVVRGVVNAVRERGDEGVREYSKKFDHYDGQAIEISHFEREAAVAALDPQTRKDTEFAIARVKAFAEAQLATMLPLDVEQLKGVHLGHRIIPIQRIGAYVPGGRYPILSAPVMTLVPAKVAGCEEVIACLPPNAHQDRKSVV